MEYAGPPQPPPGRTQPLPTGEPPATRDDIRSLRRWIAVAGIWAVAATTIAIIALVNQDNSGNERQATDLASRISRIQRSLGRRLDGLERRIGGLPRSQDLSKLERRLRKVEDDSSKASRDAKRTGDKVSDLEKRVDDLEKQQGQ